MDIHFETTEFHILFTKDQLSERTIDSLISDDIIQNSIYQNSVLLTECIISVEIRTTLLLCLETIQQDLLDIYLRNIEFEVTIKLKLTRIVRQYIQFL